MSIMGAFAITKSDLATIYLIGHDIVLDDKNNL